jgi:hypothetical protein
MISTGHLTPGRRVAVARSPALTLPTGVPMLEHWLRRHLRPLQSSALALRVEAPAHPARLRRYSSHGFALPAASWNPLPH